ncbi:MAG: hypothetical protein GTN65_05910 [Armatimonadetes bacterium]|nr:hypothetical protein [Armatimonadota bacterium]NIO96627.1 hypothetical protein [Armatimonadota bacterium]
MQPFEPEETRCYIQHQLSVAGISFSVQFTVESTGKIHDLSGGIPRMINVLCERAMMSAFIEGSRKIGVHNVVEGWESLNRTRTLGGRVL